MTSSKVRVLWHTHDVVALGPSLHWYKGNPRRPPHPTPPPPSSYNPLLFDDSEFLAAVPVLCSWHLRNPIPLEFSCSLSLGNQQKTMPTLPDFP